MVFGKRFPSARAIPSGCILVLALSGWALVLFASKLWLVGEFGSNTPFWDQWDAEADKLFGPFVSGQLRIASLFEAHNEHRIFTTRLLSLALLVLNGIWSPMVEMTVNAGLFAVSVVLGAYLLGVAGGSFVTIATCALASSIFALPFGWENTLSGFQSQFYFVIFFGFLGIWWLTTEHTWSWRWLLGLFAAVLAYFSLASGALVLAAALGGLLLRDGEQRWERKNLLAYGLLAALLGLELKSVPPLDHKSLSQIGFGNLMIALATGLAWPLQSPWLAVLRNLPLIFLAADLLKRKWPTDPRHWFILTIGIWTLLQTLALAYGRTNDIWAPRYLDLHALGVLSNAAALAAWLHGYKKRPGIRNLPLSSLWLLTMAWAVWANFHAVSLPGQLEAKREASQRQTDNLVRYLESGDRDWLRRLPYFHLPYPDPDRLAHLTGMSSIQEILPGHLHPELRVNDVVMSGAFAERAIPSAISSSKTMAWGNYDKSGGATTDALSLSYPEFPVVARAGGIAFDVAGYPLSTGGIRVEQGARSISLAFKEEPGNHWQTHYVGVEDEALKIRVVDRESRNWVAISNVVAAGRLESGAKFLQQEWRAVLLLGFVMLCLSFAAAKISRSATALKQSLQLRAERL